jgi:hypothetical protein
MKKLSLLSLALLGVLFLSNCKKETQDGGATNNTETPKQRAVAIYFGGTWCSPCGSSGKPTKEQLTSTLKDDVVLISCQMNGAGGSTDPMNCADANSLAIGFATNGSLGLPTIFIGGSNQPMQGIGPGSTMSSTTITNANAIISKAPIADVSATASISGGNITVNTKTKFLKDQSDEYLVAAYLLENGLSATQTSDASTKKNIHDNVLRKKLSSSVFGDAIGMGFKTGDVKEKSFTISVDPSWNASNLSIAVVLWNKTSMGVTMCNGVNVKL